MTDISYFELYLYYFLLIFFFFFLGRCIEKFFKSRSTRRRVLKLKRRKD